MTAIANYSPYRTTIIDQFLEMGPLLINNMPYGGTNICRPASLSNGSKELRAEACRAAPICHGLRRP